MSNSQQDSRLFYQFIIDQVMNYQEVKTGRMISDSFQSLPSKEDFSDYYDIVDEPISLDEIQLKIDENSYTDVSYLKDDFKLMAENAMLFNKKSSIIYKDAKLIMDIVDDAEDLYRINQKLNQEAKGVLNSIYQLEVSETGELAASFFKQLPPASEKNYYQSVSQPISLYDIEKKVEGNKYSGLGEFKSDLLMLIENAILYYGPDSVQAKAAFIIKDTIKNLPEEQGVSTFTSDPSELPGPEIPELVWKNGQDVFRVGDFLYLLNENDTAKPLIGQIFNIYKSKEDEKLGIRVCWFFRPEQTIHKANTKFLTNEVLKCNQFENYKVDEILGRCLVLFIKDYIRGKPKNIDMEHVYVCESRYNMNAKTQTKIKWWHSFLPESIKHIEPDLELYSTPLTLQRFPLDRSLISSPPQQRKKRKEVDVEFVDESTSGGGLAAKKRIIAEKAASQFNFSSMTKQTKDLITRLHSQRPLYVVPTPVNQRSTLPDQIIQVFDSRKDGIIRWCSAPPIDIVSTRIPLSKKYIEFKAKQKMKRESSGVGMMLIDNDMKMESVRMESVTMEGVRMERDQEKNSQDELNGFRAIEKVLYEYAAVLEKGIVL